MSFLKCERLAEDLYLDKDVKVSGKIVKYLKDYQIEGIRFLYKNYKNKTGCILNDESKLGKCLLVSVFIGCLKTNNKTLIICKNKDKIGLWMFHLEILTSKKIGLKADVGIIDVSSIENVDQNQWNYIVLDERGSDLFSENDFKLIKRINCSTKLILLADDIIEDLKHFYNVLEILNREEINQMKFSDFKVKYLIPSIGEEDFMRKRENLQNFCRTFRLRRFAKRLPLEEPTVFNSLYEKWKRINFEKTKIEIPVIKETVPVEQTNSSNLFDFVNSGEELKTSNLNPEPDEVNKTVDIFEKYKNYNKKLHDSEEVELPKNSEAIIEESSFELFLTEDEICPSTNESFLNHNVYTGGDDLFLTDPFEMNSQTSTKSSENIHNLRFTDSNKLILESSHDVEILEPKNSVVILSSEELRSLKSPDLFSDLENDELENPIKFSTPINSLLNSNNNKFSPTTNDKTDIFEITENEAFPNIIKINSDTEMSPLRFTESDDEPNPDLSKTIDFNLLYSSVFAENSNLNETIKRKSPQSSCEKIPSSSTKSKQTTPKGWFTKQGSCEKTPSSSSVELVSKQTPISSTKSKQTTPKGWFTKQIREDGTSNPKRRRKLELSFKNTSLESCKLASQKKRIKGRNRIVISSDEEF